MRDWIEEFFAILERSRATQACIFAGIVFFGLFMIGGAYFANSFEFQGAPANFVQMIREKIIHRYDKAAWIALGTFVIMAIRCYCKDRKRLLGL